MGEIGLAARATQVPSACLPLLCNDWARQLRRKLRQKACVGFLMNFRYTIGSVSYIAMKICSFPWVFLPSSVHTRFLFYPNIALFVLSFRLVLPVPYIYDIRISSSILAVVLYSVFLVFLCRSLLFISCHFCVLNISILGAFLVAKISYYVPYPSVCAYQRRLMRM